MNKYQEYIMNIHHSYIYYVSNNANQPCFDGEKITIKQEEDITITKYDFHVANCAIDCVYAIKDGQEKELKTSIDPVYSSPKSGNQKRFSIKIDFNNRIEAIKITFINKIVDDLILPIVYEEADKEKYYAKKEQERKDELLKKANIKVATGADLVNIYFQPCCDKYNHTEILLYIPNEVERKIESNRIKTIEWSLIKKCNVEAEDYYKSINGLAYGKYAFILKQFDKKGKIILETDYINFEIKKPITPGCKPTVTFGRYT